MSDFLSQDQIDKLIKEAEFSSDEETEKESGADPREVLAGGFNLFAKHASSVIGQVINKTVEVELDTTDFISEERLSNFPGDEQVVVEIKLSAPEAGTLLAIFDKNDVAKISDLMLMGDGTGEYSEEHLDAISELVSQVFGAFSTELKDTTGGEIALDGISAKVFSVEDSGLQSAKDYCVLLDILIEEEASQIHFGIPKAVAEALMTVFPSAEDSQAADSFGITSEELDEINSVVGEPEQQTFQSDFSSPQQLPSNANVEMLLDIDLDVSIELGTTNLSIKRILELAPGSIVELDKMAGEPVDLLVNGKVVARGEVVVVDENFGIRLISLVSPQERIKSLR